MKRIKPPFISRFSGEDYVIICQSDDVAQNNFTFIGVFVFVISFVCFISTIYFAYHVFNEKLLIAMIVGVVWTFLIVNIYLLMLYTISPAILKKVKKTEMVKENAPIYFANIYRIGFLILIALLISEPIRLLVLSLITNDSSYNGLTFMQQMKIANSTYPTSHIVTIVFIILFVVPIFWKFRIRKKSDFYLCKQKIEEQIVLDEYSHFKREYAKIFFKKYEKDVHFYETYVDPPFNTIKKTDDTNYETQEHLLNRIYAE